MLITCTGKVHGAWWSLFTLQASLPLSSALLNAPWFGPLLRATSLRLSLPSGLWLGLADGSHQWEIGGWRRMRLGRFFPSLPVSLPRFLAVGFNSGLGGPPHRLSVIGFPSLSLRTRDPNFLLLLVLDCLKIHLGSLCPAHTPLTEIL